MSRPNGRPRRLHGVRRYSSTMLKKTMDSNGWSCAKLFVDNKRGFEKRIVMCAATFRTAIGQS